MPRVGTGHGFLKKQTNNSSGIQCPIIIQRMLSFYAVFFSVPPWDVSRSECRTEVTSRRTENLNENSNISRAEVTQRKCRMRTLRMNNFTQVNREKIEKFRLAPR